MNDRSVTTAPTTTTDPTTTTVTVPETPHHVMRPADTDGAAEDDGTVHPGRGGLIMTATAPSAPTVMTPRVAVGHSLMWARLALALSGITENVPGRVRESIS
jgi:hypothetical protein